MEPVGIPAPQIALKHLRQVVSLYRIWRTKLLDLTSQETLRKSVCPLRCFWRRLVYGSASWREEVSSGELKKPTWIVYQQQINITSRLLYSAFCFSIPSDHLTIIGLQVEEMSYSIYRMGGQMQHTERTAVQKPRKRSCRCQHKRTNKGIPCPDDWVQKQGKCYKFYMNFKS